MICPVLAIGGDKEDGFTLIELLVVIAIVGILSAIAVPNFLTFMSKSRRTELLTGLGGIYTVEMAYFASHDLYKMGSLSNCLPGPPFNYYDRTFTIGGFFNLSQEAKFYGFCMDYDNTPGVQSFEAYAAGNIDTDALWDRALISEGNRIPTFTHDDITNLP